MRFAEIPRVRRCLGRLFADAKLRKDRGDAPKGGFTGNASPRVLEFLLQAEVSRGYPNGFSRLELLEQAARYLMWASSLAEAPWPHELENFENEVRPFWAGFNAYLNRFLSNLRDLAMVTCWASAEEADAVSRAAPLHNTAKDLKRVNDEILWMTGDRLIVQAALTERALELLKRTEVFSDPSTAARTLRALFERERAAAGLVSPAGGSALVPATFQERYPDSPLASLSDSALALLAFEPQLRGLAFNEKRAYADSVLFFGRRPDDADAATARDLYRVCASLDLPSAERRQRVEALFSRPGRKDKVPMLPRFSKDMAGLSLLAHLFVMAERDLTPEKKEFLSQLSASVLRSGTDKTIGGAVKEFLTSEEAGQLMDRLLDLAEVFGEGRLKKTLKVTGKGGHVARAILNASSVSAVTESDHDIEGQRTAVRNLLERVIDTAFGSINDNNETKPLLAKLGDMRARYEHALGEDLDYFEGRNGFEMPSTKRRRETIVGVLKSLLDRDART